MSEKSANEAVSLAKARRFAGLFRSIPRRHGASRGNAGYLDGPAVRNPKA